MSPQILTVTSARRAADQPDKWLVHLNPGDGRAPYAFLFPDDTLEWRAAEYGIDPRHIDLLLDIVLHEPWLPDPAEPGNADQDPAAAHGLIAPAVHERHGVRIGDPTPVTLWNAESIDDARTAHLLRIQACQRERVHVVSRPPPDGADPLDVIRRESPLDPEVIAIKAEHVTRLRAALRAKTAEPRRPQPSRAERYRRLLLHSDHPVEEET